MRQQQHSFFRPIISNKNIQLIVVFVILVTLLISCMIYFSTSQISGFSSTNQKQQYPDLSWTQPQTSSTVFPPEIEVLKFDNKLRDYIDKSSSTVVTSLNSKEKYDANKTDIQYHLPEEEVLKMADGIGNYGTFVKKDNKLQYIPWQNTIIYPVYYKPSSLLFSPSTYVPTYEDTVYARLAKNN